MSTLLIKNISFLVTMDDQENEFTDYGIFCRDGFIEKIDKSENLSCEADQVVNLKDHIVLPGLVNTHHHFYQTLTRAIPPAQNANLFNWLRTLYPIWAKLQPNDIFVSTQTALAELALSGCTTASDHLYLFPNGCRLDDEIEASKKIGLRLHASRGSMSLGESKGGLPPDSVVDSEEHILADSQRLIEEYHDPNPGSMVQIVLAPCSPFSVTGNLMKQSAILAREYNIHLHTHLAETEDEDAFCLQMFGKKPVAYMQEVNWIGNDVWFAHSVHVNKEEINLFAEYGCGVAHCPGSNMRLASGIAPILKMVSAGVKVGIGVDGSASNDSSHLLAEARLAMLLSRVGSGLEGASLSSDQDRPIMTARQAIKIATKGGARVLGRDDIGTIEVGKCADLIAINLNRLEYAGALHDPTAAILFCNTHGVDWNIVGGKIIVEEGHFLPLEIEEQIKKHNRIAKRLVEA